MKIDDFIEFAWYNGFVKSKTYLPENKVHSYIIMNKNRMLQILFFPNDLYNITPFIGPEAYSSISGRIYKELEYPLLDFIEGKHEF